MRTYEEAWRRGVEARVQTSQVADGVDGHPHACSFHPSTKQCMNCVHRWHEEETCDLTGNLGARGDLPAAGDDAGGAICIRSGHLCLYQSLRRTRASM